MVKSDHIRVVLKVRRKELEINSASCAKEAYNLNMKIEALKIQLADLEQELDSVSDTYEEYQKAIDEIDALLGKES